MVSYKTYAEREVSEAADIVLKNRLYVSGWLMSGLMKKLRESSSEFSDVEIVLAFDEQIPVGVCVHYSKEDFMRHKYSRIQAFVRKQYRRNGIGSKMVRRVKKTRPFAYHGVDGSDLFWHSVGVPVV